MVSKYYTRVNEIMIKKAINRSFSMSRNKKNKLKTIQLKKLQNLDVIEDRKIRHFSKF